MAEWPKEMSLNYKGKQRLRSADDEMDCLQVVPAELAQDLYEALKVHLDFNGDEAYGGTASILARYEREVKT